MQGIARGWRTGPAEVGQAPTDPADCRARLDIALHSEHDRRIFERLRLAFPGTVCPDGSRGGQLDPIRCNDLYKTVQLKTIL